MKRVRYRWLRVRDLNPCMLPKCSLSGACPLDAITNRLNLLTLICWPPLASLPLWERAFRRDLARSPDLIRGSCASRMAGRVRGESFGAAKPLTPHREPFPVRMLSHKGRAGVGCAAQACFIASPPMTRGHVKEQGLAERRKAASVAQIGQPSGAPLAAIY